MSLLILIFQEKESDKKNGDFHRRKEVYNILLLLGT